MAKTWAEEYVAALKFKLCGGCEAECDEQILLAVQDALAKAATIADQRAKEWSSAPIATEGSRVGGHECEALAALIRALGAKP
jgi:hypothetical protein